MPQTRFTFPTIPEEKKKAFDDKITELFYIIKNSFKHIGTFQKVLNDTSKYGSFDLVIEQEPEQFVKENLIRPLITFLGYEITSEIVVNSMKGRRKPDYLIRPISHEEPAFYVEAEPFNTDLWSEGHGINQIREWIGSRGTRTDYGIATDGIKWIVVKYNPASIKPKVVHQVDLRNIFLSLLDPNHTTLTKINADIDKTKTEFLKLSQEYVLPLINNYLEDIEEKKEAISKRFYNEYVKNVFGCDSNGEPINGICLTNKISTPIGASKSDINLFSVVFMNRLIFVKFLEDKGIVQKDFLKVLHNKYNKNRPPSSFYKTYLESLFFECFNKSNNRRPSQIQTDQLLSNIPYLNGGLFREVVTNERLYDIENEGIDLVLDNIFTKYSFGSDSDIDPNILGYIFEKTINYISGTGTTNEQKMKGAYYTPDDIVSFLIEKTLIPVLFEKMIDTLRSSKWNESDIAGYTSLDNLLEKLPNNPIFIDNMIEAINNVRVLDPSCGSGHFLTALLSEILRVKETLLIANDKAIDRYKLKKEIISENIYGVDIDRNAVEIARLRLWLSLIDDVVDTKNIDTLPNIDFHVIAGNSLIGWLNEPLKQQSIIDLTQDQYIRGILEGFEVFYPDRIHKVRYLLSTMHLLETIEAYEILSEIYNLESGERAVQIRLIVEKIRAKLYNVINSAYLGFINEHSKLKKDSLIEFNKYLPSRDPFHWGIDFENVLSNGGFDVIVGNPPYVEAGNYEQTDPSKTDLNIIKLSSKTDPTIKLSTNYTSKKDCVDNALFYESRYCGNTHAYFIERSIKLLNSKGRFGFIVPVAIVSTDRMSSIINFINNNSSEVNYFNFDDRPAKIFSGIEDCRSTIIITKAGKGVNEISTSKYHRWVTSERANFLNNLNTVSWAISNLKIPKIGHIIEKEILTKLTTNNNDNLSKYILEDGERIWYHNAPRYWIHAHFDSNLPRIEHFGSCTKVDNSSEIIPKDFKEARVSSHYKAIVVDSKYKYIVNGLLNSSLFYWWFIAWSDGRDLLNQQIASFPLSLNKFPANLGEVMKTLVEELMLSYDNNSRVKINNRKKGKYCIRIKEMIPKRSKIIIDQIDDVLAEYFELTKEEKQFIKEFDVKFRMEGEE